MELTVIDCEQPPPPPNGESTQLVSLSAELSLLEDALTAAANIAELLAMKSLPSDEAAAQAPIAINGVLAASSLLGGRNPTVATMSACTSSDRRSASSRRERGSRRNAP